MSRNASGTYALPAGNPVTSGTTISSSWANVTLSDLETEVTDSLSRSGKGPMLAVLKLVDGAKSGPGITFDNEQSSGLYRNAAGDVRMSVLNGDVMRFQDGVVPEVWDGAAFQNILHESATVTSLDIDGGTIDGAVIGGNSAAAATFTDLIASGTINFNGATVSDLGTVTTADINGGTIDGVTIGDTSPIPGVSSIVLTVSNIASFSGATISDLGSVTTADINGGTVDDTTIGGTTAAAGTFTTLTGTTRLEAGTSPATTGIINARSVSGAVLANLDFDDGVDTGAFDFNCVTGDGQINYAGTGLGGDLLIDCTTGDLRLQSSSDDVVVEPGGSAVGYFTAAGRFGIGGVPSAGQLHIQDAGPFLRLEDTDGGVADVSALGGNLALRSDAGDSVASSTIEFFVDGTQVAQLDSEAALVLYNGTAPTTSATDGVKLYSEDVSTSAELKVRDEAGNVTTLSPHNFNLIPDGPSEPMAWAYYSERDGWAVNVDMLKLARTLERLSGEKLVYEAVL